MLRKRDTKTRDREREKNALEVSWNSKRNRNRFGIFGNNNTRTSTHSVKASFWRCFIFSLNIEHGHAAQTCNNTWVALAPMCTFSTVMLHFFGGTYLHIYYVRSMHCTLLHIVWNRVQIFMTLIFGCFSLFWLAQSTVLS